MRLRVALVISVFIAHTFGLILAPIAFAASTGLELSELLVDPAAPETDAKDEFIEFHNAGTIPLELSDYVLKFGTKIYPLPTQSLAQGGYIALMSANVPWSLTNTGGTVMLQTKTGEVLDTTSWPKAITGQGWAKSPDNTWAWTTTPTPAAANQITPASGSETDGIGVAAPGSHPDVYLNELLPDPAAPLTDAKDEFIELYNSSPEPADLAGYTIKTGATLATSHKISGIVPAGGYLALKSADTKIALANTGSSVALFDPTGAQVGETVTYDKAKTGDAWARFDDRWAWTTTPTPGYANQLTEPPAVPAITKATKSIAASKAVKTAAAAKTPKTPKTAKAAAAKSPKSSAKLPSLNQAASNPGGRWLLFALAGLTIAYVIYEFRYDLRNLYFRLRGYPGSSSTPRETAPGRGSDRAGERPRRWQDHLRAGLSTWARLRRRSHQPDVHAQPSVQPTLF